MDDDVFGNHSNGDYWVLKLSSVTGIETQSLFNNVKIYPNPANNKVNIITRNVAMKQSVSIYNMQGQEVKKIKTKGQSKKYIVNINELPTGLYLLKVKGDKRTEVTKFIKK